MLSLRVLKTPRTRCSVSSIKYSRIQFSVFRASNHHPLRCERSSSGRASSKNLLCRKARRQRNRAAMIVTSVRPKKRNQQLTQLQVKTNTMRRSTRKSLSQARRCRYLKTSSIRAKSKASYSLRFKLRSLNANSKSSLMKMKTCKETQSPCPITLLGLRVNEAGLNIL